VTGKGKYSEIKDDPDLTQIEHGFELSCMELEQDCNGTWNLNRTCNSNIKIKCSGSMFFPSSVSVLT